MIWAMMVMKRGVFVNGGIGLRIGMGFRMRGFGIGFWGMDLGLVWCVGLLISGLLGFIVWCRVGLVRIG